jgi:hypothetical protein
MAALDKAQMARKTSMDHSWRFLCHPLATCAGGIMRFYLFERQADAHIRKSREFLEEAHLRRVEHQAAAEHHSALAKMYAQRIARIEAEISDAFQVRPSSAPPGEEAGNENVRLKSDSMVSYPSLASHG